MFYTFDALSEFTAAERGLVVATMRAIEDKTGCVQFRKVESHLKTLMDNFQGGRCRWSCRLGVDHGPTRKRVRAFSPESQEKLPFHLGWRQLIFGADGVSIGQGWGWIADCPAMFFVFVC